MEKPDQDTINQLVRVIVQEVNPQEVILFGSHIR